MPKNFDLVKLLVITSCAGEKKYNPPNSAVARDLDDLRLRQNKEKELEAYRIKAKEMFISSQNQMIYEGLSYLTGKSQIEADIAFVSSGYGFLKEDDYVVPYDINFSAMSKIALDKRSTFLKIHEEIYYASKNYDLVFFLLANEYIKVLKLPIILPENIKQIFFISHSDEKLLPLSENVFIIPTGNEEASKFEVTPAELKGYIFRLVCQFCKSDSENTFEKIYNEPSFIKEIIRPQLKNSGGKAEQLGLFD